MCGPPQKPSCWHACAGVILNKILHWLYRVEFCVPALEQQIHRKLPDILNLTPLGPHYICWLRWAVGLLRFMRLQAFASASI